MTRPPTDPLLSALGPLVPDVDLVELPSPSPDRRPPVFEGPEAKLAAALSVRAVRDALVDVWEVLGDVPTPASFEAQWFTHPTGDARWVTPQVRTRVTTDAPIDLHSVAAVLERLGWGTAVDERPAWRLLAGRANVRVELQRRGRLVLMRAQTGYLSLGEHAHELVAIGTRVQAWPGG